MRTGLLSRRERRIRVAVDCRSNVENFDVTLTVRLLSFLVTAEHECAATTGGRSRRRSPYQLNGLEHCANILGFITYPYNSPFGITLTQKLKKFWADISASRHLGQAHQ